MRFCLLNRIVDLKVGVSLKAEKTLTGQEDYLADHFPLFPVMPGVLMLEAMSQASAWLVRATQNFEYSVVTLVEARGVKYADFVVPGKTLLVSVEIQKQEGRFFTLKTQGFMPDSQAVSARLTLECYNLGERYPTRAASDSRAKHEARLLFKRLGGEALLPSPLMQV
jgi:3-hydroxyacyl-[acyl-carrier-protein] dehydratase